MQSNLSQSIELTWDKARYDASVKEMFADKQILARILKYAVEEFAEDDISDIMKEMDEPVVSGIRLEPGHTNQEKVQQTASEDIVLGEGKIYFDIRFSVNHGKDPIKILVNIEAQKSTNPSKLGYHLDNRILFYLGRMISAQKEVEFTHSSYDDLKAVRSIWICMDSADDEDSINRIRFTQDTVFGKEMYLEHIDKVQGIIIRLRQNEEVETSKNILIAMLEQLLKKENVTEKKKILSQEYGLIMDVETERKVNTMCNLSEVVLEKGISQGITQGITQGTEQHLISQVCKKILKNKSVAEMADELETDEETISKIISIAEKYAPEYDMEKITAEYLQSKK